MAESPLNQANTPSPDCLNCGTRLTGEYCANCGQRAHLKPLSLWELLKEFAEEFFDLDSKAWRSIVPLMFLPGRVTTDYFVGRRARHLSPLRLYLTASVLFFIIAAFTDNTIPVAWDDVDFDRAPPAVSDRTDVQDRRIAEAGGCEAILANAEARLSDYWRDRAYTACQKVTADRGRSLERAAVDNIPIMMVVFIPVLALVMKLLYPFSGRFYVEHVVFYLHYHAFGFFLMTLMILVYEFGTAIEWSRTAWRTVSVVSSCYMAIYLLIAMRRVYQQGWIATSAKFIALFFAYLIGLSISFLAVVMYAAMTL
ncbi:MAG: DUF3667 domain-containing protein [Gammaproteobacteria bacterium]|nr:DUF3667 domain-containing protein [Gammaproteobacteria bacterium]